MNSIQAPHAMGWQIFEFYGLMGLKHVEASSCQGVGGSSKPQVLVRVRILTVGQES